MPIESESVTDYTARVLPHNNIWLFTYRWAIDKECGVQKL